jgi:hypothetical protein
MKNTKDQQEPMDAPSDSLKLVPNPDADKSHTEQSVGEKPDGTISRKKKKPSVAQPVVENAGKSEQAIIPPNIPVSNAETQMKDSDSLSNQKGDNKSRVQLIGTLISGLIVGFLLGYFLLTVPLQSQLALITEANFNGNSSSNLMKSDLSNTKLKQEEMETRYMAVTAQLESANQYIFLLRMKEQISFARLMVEQKEGMKARQALSEIQDRFNHLKPFIIQKDPKAASNIDELLKVSIQHLASDPESVKSDLTGINDLLSNIETMLFQPE